MSPHSSLQPSPALASSLASATRALRAARSKRDQRKALALHDSFFAGGNNPRQLLAEAATDEQRRCLRRWFEAWDDVLLRWWLAPKRGDPRLVKRLCLGEDGGVAFSLLQMNAWWLRESGSSRVCTGYPLPAPDLLRALKLIAQCRHVARFCLRTDAGVPFDYAAYAGALSPELRPFLAQWFLKVYLLSPWSNLDDEVRANRSAAAEQFGAFHETHDAGRLPLDPLLTVSGYRATWLEGSPRLFLSALSDAILAPALKASESPIEATEVSTCDPPPEIGVYLSCFDEGHAVQRSIDPMLDAVRRKRVVAFVPAGADGRPLVELPALWREEQISVRLLPGVETPQGVTAAVRRIREAKLDFLFYAEVGLTTGSRWLSTQRLARVQATGYGHPVTTGSQAIDYFVGGQAIEGDGSTYRERLVLLPGLGVSVTEPLLPSRPRQRPLCDGNILLAGAPGFDKLNPPLLRLWSAILDRLPHARLCLLTAVAAGRLGRFTELVRPHIDLSRVQLVPHIPRQACVDILQEADVYLDAFPYAGGNSVVEAIACGCPVVTLEGRAVYERSGAAIIRELGLPEDLIAHSQEEYADAVARLVEEPDRRGRIRAGLSEDPMLWKLRSPDTARHFAAAVEWMRRTGPNATGAPVLIQRDSDA